MSTSAHDFELSNVAAGPDPFRLSEVASDEGVDAVVLLFQRDYHCTKCRSQVQDVAARYEEFEAEDAVVAAVLPEPDDRAADWQDSYDLPFPLLADASKAVSDEYDQPTRFGALGSLHDLVGRMPKAVVFDARSGTPEVAAVDEGSTPADRPDVEAFLAAVRDLDSAAL
ncbi:redoxin domain-containing protein [Natronomonas marina]|jgi:peroxiredoxin Q/BCP|uniref:redoxin domain-containing protein n=1 Tax=Natronomonas marina TaxID=2961939 RepID=UPI0020CA1367|nr:redoxin domain-containing protein [Natronomonas marina]